MKANPAPEILKLLAALGCCFDVASVAETEAVLAAGATPDRISYGNTIKKESEIAAAFALGVALFAVDCEAEVEKIARAAPGSRVICRIVCDGAGAEWPLSRKFGCEPDYAADILELAHKPGWCPRHLLPRRLAAAQCGSLGPRARLDRGGVPRLRRARHQPLDGQSRRRLPGALRAQDAEARNPTARRSSARCASISATPCPNTIVEPGRGLVGNAGVIEAEVVLIAKRSPEDELRWVYLDIGKFHGLAETIDESIRYPIRTTRIATRRALHHRRADLQFGRRAVREDALPAAGLALHRRQGPDRGGRRLHRDLFVGRLQRLSAAAPVRDLTAARPARCAKGLGRNGRLDRPRDSLRNNHR